MNDRNQGGRSRPSRRIIWILGGLLIVALVIFSLQGVIRGGGEAAGITKEAPGDDNANPAPETVNDDKN